MYHLIERETQQEVFKHTSYNACIGQAKFFHRHEGRTANYMIWDDTDRTLSVVNSYAIQFEN